VRIRGSSHRSALRRRSQYENLVSCWVETTRGRLRCHWLHWCVTSDVPGARYLHASLTQPASVVSPPQPAAVTSIPLAAHCCTPADKAFTTVLASITTKTRPTPTVYVISLPPQYSQLIVLWWSQRTKRSQAVVGRTRTVIRESSLAIFFLFQLAFQDWLFLSRLAATIKCFWFILLKHLLRQVKHTD